MKRATYARYGPADRYDGPPAAGMCISVFAIVQKGNDKGRFLIGLPKKELDRWHQDWLYSKIKDPNPETLVLWILPSCYMKSGESPRKALARIMNEQLGIKKFKILPEQPRIVSYYSPSSWYPGNRHWDLAFIYTTVITKGVPENIRQRYWRDLRFVRKGKDIKTKNFGWNSDLMSDLRLN